MDSLLDALPDLVLLMRRDGVVLDRGGGQAVADLKLDAQCVGRRIDEFWPATVADLLARLARRAIADRAAAQARFEERGRDYEARVTAQGPDRALCVIRPLPASAERPAPQLDRRGFLQRFNEAISLAALREQPIAVAVIQVDGMNDIAQVIDGRIAEQLMSAAVLRLPPQSCWFLGQLGDSLLALVLELSDRDAIESRLAAVCASLREPISLAAATFELTAFAGVAILGRDANSPSALLDHARAAATQAQRAGSGRVCFFSDTLRVRSLARLDIAHELRVAIDNGDVRLRYVSRHDLADARVVSWAAYVRWIHPIRGEVRPAEFLRVAESTGLAPALSRAVLDCLQQDFAALASHWDPEVRVSFGALRHHLLREDFTADVLRLLEAGVVPAERLELRIAEKTFIASEAVSLKPLTQLGVRLVVDEVGRGLGSLGGLARAPIWGLQLDRAWVAALLHDEVARKVCCAGLGLAGALGLTAMANGVDGNAQREALLAMGCRYGGGDLYREAAPEIMKPYRAAVTD